jgi:hypothetical protein
MSIIVSATIVGHHSHRVRSRGHFHALSVYAPARKLATIAA